MTEGDITLAPLPQADGQIKNRPIVLLRRLPPFGDFLVCGVSTQLHQRVAGFDETIAPATNEVAPSGLKASVGLRLRQSAALRCPTRMRSSGVHCINQKSAPMRTVPSRYIPVHLRLAPGFGRTKVFSFVQRAPDGRSRRCGKLGLGICLVLALMAPLTVRAVPSQFAVGANGAIIVVKSDGTLWSWNDGGLPAQIGSDTNWAKVATAAGFSSDSLFALKSDGSLWAWGDNSWGQVGIGSSSADPIPRPTRVPGSWTAVFPQRFKTFATASDGALWVWGGTNYIPGETQAPAGGWTDVLDTEDAAYAVRSDGSLWTCPYRAADFGDLGVLGLGITNVLASYGVGTNCTNVVVPSNTWLPTKTWQPLLSQGLWRRCVNWGGRLGANLQFPGGAYPLFLDISGDFWTYSWQDIVTSFVDALYSGTNAEGNPVLLAGTPALVETPICYRVSIAANGERGTQINGGQIDVTALQPVGPARLISPNPYGPGEVTNWFASYGYMTNYSTQHYLTLVAATNMGGQWCSFSMAAPAYYAGTTAYYGVRPDGTLWVWGSETNGLLTQPRRIDSDTDWIKVSGDYAQKADGTLWSLEPAPSPVLPLGPPDFSDVCSVAPQTSTLSGIAYAVSDQGTNALPGVTVSIQGTEAITDGNGHYSISGLIPGNFLVAASAPSFASELDSVQILKHSSQVQDFYLAPDTSDVKIGDVTSEFGPDVYFLAGVPLMSHISAAVDWGTNGYGTVSFGGQQADDEGVYGNVHLFEADMDVGNPGNFGGANVLIVRAVAVNGKVREKVSGLRQMGYPAFLGSVGFGVKRQPGLAYTSTAPAPLSLFAGVGLGAGVIPSTTVVIGGQPDLLTADPLVNATIYGNGQMTLTPAKSSAEHQVAGHDFSFPEQAQGALSWDGTEWGVNAMQLNLPQGGALLRPGGQVTPLTFPVFNLGFFQLSLVFGVSPAINITSVSPFDAGGGTLDLTAGVEGVAHANIGIAEARGAVDGKLDTQFGLPAPYVRGAQFELYAHAYARLFLWETQTGFTNTWMLAGPRIALNPADNVRWSSAPSGPLEIIGRQYAARPGYVALRGRPWPRPLDATGPVGLAAISPLQQNVIPFAEPSLSAAGTNLYALWLYDNTNRTSLNRTEAVFSKYTNSVWTQPQPLADTGTANFQPQVMAFEDGSALASWVNLTQNVPDNTTLQQYMALAEINVTAYDPARQAWGAPVRLTTNTWADLEPRLAASWRSAPRWPFTRATPGRVAASLRKRPCRAWSRQTARRMSRCKSCSLRRGAF